MIHVKKMGKQDINRVSEIMCNCYRWLGEKEGYTKKQVDFLISKRGSIESIKAESQNQLYLVAYMDKTIVGMVALKDNEITKLYIDPKYHKQSVGTTLFDAAEQAVIHAGYKEVLSGVSANSAVGFYEKMGMTITDSKVLKTNVWNGHKVTLMKKCLPQKECGKSK
jgi:ribosomal protein S18 acetylase RimI-like enzyme